MMIKLSGIDSFFSFFPAFTSGTGDKTGVESHTLHLTQALMALRKLCGKKWIL